MRCPGDADRLDQRVRDRTGLLTAVNFSTGKDMPERHDMFSFSEGQEEHPSYEMLRPQDNLSHEASLSTAAALLGWL
ncbi:hypothetical protein CgunFtcFv8_015651 [Champsocephalus gunnari]|uniref:Uncharacterized protein n=1 Tax=Champsocephalus gunnari TaxID=52237 RepID=A0AAN8C700_CHAGU|nr:hypothetical protein CgunFtcFv8_015651 [Champsocephalus gunnari]